jgi:hypothetical protein
MQLLQPLRNMNQLKHDLLLTLAQEEPLWTRTMLGNTDLT